MKAYAVTGQMSLFDFIADTSKRFPSLVQELSEEVKAILINGDNPGYTEDEDNYTVWSNVPNLGYRYKLYVSVKVDEKYDKKIDALYKVKDKYLKDKLELELLCSPDIFNDGYIKIFVSSIWHDRKRAKTG